MAKTASKSSPQRKFSLQAVNFAILPYSLYGCALKFQAQVRISTIGPVFPDYLSVSYDYDLTRASIKKN